MICDGVTKNDLYASKQLPLLFVTVYKHCITVRVFILYVDPLSDSS